jgi:hypothetical protein
MCALWGSYELDAYLNQLITDTRGGQRKGFPAADLVELMFVVELNRLIRAIDLAKLTKISLKEAAEKIEARDEGTGFGDAAHASRDVFTREGPDLARKKRNALRAEAVAKDTGGGGLGKLLFLLVLLLVIYLLVFR